MIAEKSKCTADRVTKVTYIYRNKVKNSHDGYNRFPDRNYQNNNRYNKVNRRSASRERSDYNRKNEIWINIGTIGRERIEIQMTINIRTEIEMRIKNEKGEEKIDITIGIIVKMVKQKIKVNKKVNMVSLKRSKRKVTNTVKFSK